MNQAIHFPERQAWLAERQQVHFPAINVGVLIDCYIDLTYLCVLAEQPLLDEASILEAFIYYRFDIEDEAEKFIRKQQFNDFGDVILKI